MAKDYSWFKFKLPDWMMGRIQKQKPEVRGVFLNLACKYWQKQCILSIEDAKEELEEVDYAYDALLKKQIIKEDGDMVILSFLDEQWAENQLMSEKKSIGGKASASKRLPIKESSTFVEDTLSSVQHNSTGVQQVLTDVEDVLTDVQICSTIKNEIREEENREDKIRTEENNNLSDEPTGSPTDQKISINKWIETFDKRKFEFQESLYPFTHKPPKYNGSYEPPMLKDFFEYWAEPNKSRSKMRWEQERTWELPLRLSRWAANQKNNKSTNQNKNVHQTAIPASNSGFHVQGRK